MSGPGYGGNSLLAVDSTGKLYVTGVTLSSNFPVTASTAVSTTGSSNNAYGGFLFKLSADGSTMLYSTYLPYAIPHSVAVDSAGRAYVVGYEVGSNDSFPLSANAYQSKFNAGDIQEAVVMKVDTLALSGSSALLYSTRFGSNTGAYAVTANNSGIAYVAGATLNYAYPGYAGTVPTRKAFQNFPGSASDAFIATFDTTQSSGDATLLTSSYLGGNGNEDAVGIALDSQGNIYLAGYSLSTNFPTTGGVFEQFGYGANINHIYAAKIDPTGQTKLAATYVDGNASDTLTGFALDASGNVYLAGTTQSANFPVLYGSAFPSGCGGSEPFALALNSTLSNLVFATSLAQGNCASGINSLPGPVIAVDNAGGAYVAGDANAGFTTTPGAYQANNNGSLDAFVTKLALSSSGNASTLTLALSSISPGAGGSQDAVLTTITGTGLTTGTPFTLSYSSTQPGGGAPVPGLTSATGSVQSVSSDGTSASVIFNLNGLQLGVYDLQAKDANQNAVTLMTAFTVVADTLSIVPAHGGNCGPVTATLWGGLFEPGASVTLSSAGTRIGGSNVTVSPDHGSLSTTFDLTGQPLGTYDVTVANSDGASKHLPAGFTIEAGMPLTLNIQYVGPPFFGEGKHEEIAVQVVNQGDVDSQPLTVTVTITNLVTLTPSIPYTVTPQGASNVYTMQPGILAAGGTLQIPIDEYVGNNITPHTPAPIQLHVQEAYPPANTSSPCSSLDPGPSGGGSGGPIDIRTPQDPNNKVGLLGAGNAQYIAPNTIPYIVYFENDANAGAPAQDVVVTDTIDPTVFDINSISFASMAFATQFYPLPAGNSDFTQTVDLRPNQPFEVVLSAHLDRSVNTITWTFHTIDPNTGQSPNDPSLGFLPPNQTSPQGQGYVTFNINPLPGQPTGTTLSNQATVVFNTNSPIYTPTWTNTLDVDPPTSSVQALPPAEPSSFTVQWSGSDNGSGIRSYNIYVSINGGAYQVWQANTAAASATYTATTSGTYAFYSIATDQVGNVEAPKTRADTTTTVTVQPACAADVSSQITVTRGGYRYNHATSSFVETVTLKNNGAALTNVSLVLDHLSSSATLSNEGGTTQCDAPTGSPWITAAGTLGAGQTATVNLNFRDPSMAGVQYSTRVLAGSGQQ